METKRTETKKTENAKAETELSSPAERMASYAKYYLLEAKEHLEEMAVSFDDKEAWTDEFKKTEKGITASLLALEDLIRSISDRGVH